MLSFVGNLYWKDKAKMNTCFSSFGKEQESCIILCNIGVHMRTLQIVGNPIKNLKFAAQSVSSHVSVETWSIHGVSISMYQVLSDHVLLC